MDPQPSSPPVCPWCAEPFRLQQRRDSIYCSSRCRKRAWRLRERSPASVSPTSPPGLRFAYADPPYLGHCADYDHNHPDGLCWDDLATHAALITRLRSRIDLAGWALSCSAKSLRDLLPLCPASIDVLPWVKPTPIYPDSSGRQSRWEALLVHGGRIMTPGVRDWLYAAADATPGRDLIGRKPIAFNAWLYASLGMVPGDHLEDWFPGTGQVGRSWSVLSRGVQDRDETSLAASDVLLDVGTAALPIAPVRGS